ncbi:putative integral membrane protein (TIGR00698 family) [Desulfitispora alkaliphila]|uniref:YeiH family protein n=1 Tax=Desulfitispora alkaliphila TaxID=622674 RepID=UPI003D1C143D
MNITKDNLQGGLLVLSIASMALLLQQWEKLQLLHLNALIIAIILGMIINSSFTLSDSLQSGIAFWLKKMLYLGIILMGFRLNISDLQVVGLETFLVVTVVSLVTIMFSLWLGKKLGLQYNLTLLIGVGSSICGASAIAAVAPLIRAKEKDIAFSIATITVFGTMSMILYPVFFHIFHLPNLFYAVWTGASVHEVAQVVVAGFAAGDQAGEFATVVKLARVMLIVPVALVVVFLEIKKQKDEQVSWREVTIPWFVIGFLVAMLLNSTVTLPPVAIDGFVKASSFSFTVAMAAMGLALGAKVFKDLGIKPFLLGLITSIFIAFIGFSITYLVYQF